MRLIKSCQTLQGKLEEAASAAQPPAVPTANAEAAPSAPQASAADESSQPPDTLNDPLTEIGQAAQPWLTARLAKLLIGLGLPAGVATLVAGATVWLLLRRARRRLQSARRTTTASGEQSVSTTDGADATATVERHHNRYVAYETSELDKAWAAAHAHVGEKYPGAVPYLKLVEGVKEQLLSGNNNPQL